MDEPKGESVTRILLVDDHEIVRAGMKDLIESEPDLVVCGQASGAPEAVELLRQTQPHIVILDLSLAEGSGIELAKQIKSMEPTTRVIVCSMHDEALYAERALHAGAMGYINKQEPVERILVAIRGVLEDRVVVSRRIADRILHRAARRDRKPGSPIETLSDRELQVLELIGQGMATRDIAETLHLSVKTIDSYRENLKAKLGLQSATELVRYAVAWTLDPDAV